MTISDFFAPYIKLDMTVILLNSCDCFDLLTYVVCTLDGGQAACNAILGTYLHSYGNNGHV